MTALQRALRLCAKTEARIEQMPKDSADAERLRERLLEVKERLARIQAEAADGDGDGGVCRRVGDRLTAIGRALPAVQYPSYFLNSTPSYDIILHSKTITNNLGWNALNL
jgi:hypothetical protein